VNAGADQTITLPATANLDGTVTDDALSALTTAWSMITGPGTVTFGDASLVDTTASFSADGVYVLRLTATDAVGSAFDDVTITVSPDTAPVVDAGLDQTITLPASASLDGTVSDTDLPPQTLITTWNMVSGPGAVTFGDASLVDTTATFSAAGEYVLQLEANDGALTTSDTVTITVNTAPTAVDDPDLANPTDYTIAQGGTLDTAFALLPGVLANDTDPDGPAALTAVLVAGPANASTFTLNPDGSFIYTHDGLGTTSDSFTYQAFDGAGNSNIATVAITVTP
jgi:hypothetical protein